MKHISLTLAVLVLLSGSAQAATVIGLTDANALVRFDSATPGSIVAGPIAITGLAGGETMRAIDYRPLTGVLYGMSSSSRLFTINPVSGVATLVGAFTPVLSGIEFGFDVNPAADRIRVVSDADQNFRLHPDTGLVAALDTPLNYAPVDPNFGANPNITSVAYTNSYPGATTTTLFSIDVNVNALVRHSNPNGGTLVTVGLLGVDVTSPAGFDIDATTGVAIAALETVGSHSRLYTVNLSTGAATLIGSIGAALHLRGIAIVPAASALVGLTTTNALVQFNANAPGTIVNGPVAITGLDPSEVMLSIDYRPATGELFGLSSFSRLFRLQATTGVATLVAPLSSSLSGTSFGFDFSPIADRARIVSNTGQNLRAVPGTGEVIVDTSLTFAGGDPNSGVPPAITGSAFTNDFFGAVTTTLYAIDSSLDALVIQSPPNFGVLSTVGPLGINAGAEVGFDIEPVLNTGWAAFVVGGTPGLYSINLGNGAATLVGAIGGGHQLRGLAVVLFGASPAATVIATGASASGPQVNVTFSPVTGADHYDVYRKAAGGSFVLAGSVVGLQFQDTGVTAGKAYLYMVRAIGPGGNSAPDSAADLATAMVFTDDPLSIGATVVKALHLSELRIAVNAVRELAGLAAASFTDTVPAGITIKAIHVTELRAALDPARTALGLSAVTYSRTLTAGTTLIAAVDVSEVRTGVK